MISLALAIHVLAAIVWVGGMFFAHMALRPAVSPMAGPERLALWGRVFAIFLPWVWAAVIALFVTGYGVVYFGYQGFWGVGWHVDLMQVLGLIMMGLFVWLYWGPYQAFRAALAAGDVPAAAAQQARIRQIVSINLPLGLIVSALAVAGRNWG
jgi:uncharacterized membrane protein